MTESPPTPLGWRQAGLLAVIAVACFHAAYTPAQSGLLAFGIVGYVICLVQLARLRTTRQCFYTALAVGFACYAPQLECFWRIFGAAAIPLWLILSVWLALFVVLTHLAIIHLGLKRTALLAPFLWTGLEYFRSELYFLKFSWLNVGYAFAESWLVPWRFVGLYAVGFLAAAAGAIILVLRSSHWKKVNPLHALIVLIIAGVFLLWRFPTPLSHAPQPTLVLAGVQVEFPESDQLSKTLDRVLVEQGRKRDKTIPSGTKIDLIVLPEYTLQGEPTHALKDWCRTNQKFLIVGGKDSSPGTNYYNTAFVISTNGEVVFKQVKCVPIQFFKDGLPAPEQKLWDSPWGKIGICICYDLSYTRVTDELVRQGAQMLIVPTMDVADWGRHQHELHARVAPVRAAEYGIPIFRVASSGISQGVDKYGRVQSSARFLGEGEMIFFGAHLEQQGSLPLDRLLAPLCVGVTVIFVGWLGFKRFNTRSREGKH